MDNVITWLVLAIGGGCGCAWLLFKLYEHDYQKIHKDNFDYWS